MSILSSIEFEYPFVLLLILLFAICTIFCKAKSSSLYFVNTNFFNGTLKSKGIISEILKFLAIAAFSVSLASPITKNIVKEQHTKGYDISLVLDISGSMNNGGKFKVVKDVVKQFVKQRKGDRLGLSVFANYAYIAAPLTYDKKSLLRLLKHINVGVAGYQNTALYEALFLSSKVFERSKAKNKIAILLTDGQETTYSIPLNVAIATAKKHGIKVYTIGVGRVGDFNPKVLKQISKETGAKFFMADSKSKLEQIYKEIDNLEKSQIKANKFIKKEYYYQYPALFTFIVLTLLTLLRRRA